MFALPGVERLSRANERLGAFWTHAKRNTEHRVDVRVERDDRVSSASDRASHGARDSCFAGAALADDGELHAALRSAATVSSSVVASSSIARIAGEV